MVVRGHADDRRGEKVGESDMTQFSQQVLNGLVTGAGFVLMALGVNLLFGVLKIVNFAHGILYILGGYITYTLLTSMGINYWMSLVLAIVLTGALSAALHPILFRRLLGRELGASMILTFGLALVLEETIRLVWGAASYSIASPLTSKTVNFGSLYINAQLAFALVVSILLVAILFVVLGRTSLGLQIRGLAEDRTMAQILGARIHVVAAMTWGIGGALTGAAGALIIPAYTLESQSAFNVAIMAFAIVIVGGLGSIWGTVVAGLLIGLVTALVDGYVISGMNEFVAFSMLLFILMFKPQGLMGRHA